jgi:nucleotide-binding universal stress UspA family protein
MVDIIQATDRDIRESMQDFQAAFTAQEPDLRMPHISRILLAVDRSNQGRISERFASMLARMNGGRILLLYAYEGIRQAEREEYLAERARALTEEGVNLEPMEEPVRTEHGLRSFEQILHTSRDKNCDLIVMPAPYLDDYVKLGQESVGVNLDMLMSRANVPLFVVRDPQVDPEACLNTVFLLITPFSWATVLAAAWALHMVRKDGMLHCIAMAESAELKTSGEIQDLDQAGMDVKTAAGLTRPEVAGLIGALQRQAAEASLKCRVSIRSHADLIALTRSVNEENRLLVFGSSTDSGSLTFQCTQSLIRASRNPVLLVTESVQSK